MIITMMTLKVSFSTMMTLKDLRHYWTQGLCRGPDALGKGSSAVGEGFAEGSPR